MTINSLTNNTISNLENTPYNRYLCRACGYVYDEKLGDPDCGLPAGTRFADIPDDWQCPLCGVKKADFELIVDCDDIEKTIGAVQNSAQDALLTNFVAEGVCPDMRPIVIIGAGLAGWAAAEALHKAAAQNLLGGAPIVMITADSGDRYHKPMLSASFAAKKTSADLVRATGDMAAKTLGITLIAQTWVLDIDTVAQQIHTTRGTVLYQKIVLALGTQPIYPPPLDDKTAWHVNHLLGWAGLAARLAACEQNGAAKTLAIVGAGMVGVELAEDLARAGHRIVLINKNHLPLAHLLPEAVAIALNNVLNDKNAGLDITILNSATVEKVARLDNGAYQLTLKHNGALVQYVVNEIIATAGLAVDTRLAQQAGIAFDGNGLQVNEFLQTNQADIYAIGDCAAINGAPCRFVAPHRAQAAAIAAHIVSELAAKTGDGDNDGDNGDTIYVHKEPPVRLKNKLIGIGFSKSPQQGIAWEEISHEAGKWIWRQGGNNDGGAVLTVVGV